MMGVALGIVTFWIISFLGIGRYCAGRARWASLAAALSMILVAWVLIVKGLP